MHFKKNVKSMARNQLPLFLVDDYNNKNNNN